MLMSVNCYTISSNDVVLRTMKFGVVIIRVAFVFRLTSITIDFKNKAMNITLVISWYNKISPESSTVFI